MAEIFALTPTGSQPIPQRTRPGRLRAMEQFSVIATWLASALLHYRGEDAKVVALERLAPALRDRVEEETLRALAALDPIAEGVARKRARQRAGDLLAKMVIQTETKSGELLDPVVLDECATRLADAVLESYRAQLVYGAPTAPEVRN